ncbi:heterokaryon incompatibility protein-domain-containing protein [Colletotrichum godetiae]|uniref:Heterokaryon incompatibility protein-domain-containing protein n=1 Tax=Colletotrichum godetiae TaxID=1209918 RepID=A0AAJ0ACX8_9PEZI|nr:heterokaryon incompatibility protein-domain-containing protein [Colletotrichum godetiae]KAK1671000.1 heterokaryon incompatibility protein-domain-containing protein [Colletotrichum godetiae]
MSSNDTQFFKRSLTSEYWVNFNVDKKFTLAGIAEPEIDSDDRNLIRTWVSSHAIPKTAPAQPQLSSLYRPILDPFETRVLEILPGSNADKLRGNLHHCSLELDARFALSVDGLATPIVYTALSYTWGANVFDETIECDGIVKNITTSLAVALKALRQEGRSVVMWIDQICINQQDHKEKEQQIPLMTRVYQGATNTVIWLGESSSHSASVIKLLEDVRTLLQFKEGEVNPEDFERLCLPPPNSEIWEALWDFLARPWFSRLWIIQEVILSHDPWVVCGNDMTTWDVLSLACLNLWTCGISRWLEEKINFGNRIVGTRKDHCELVQRLSEMKAAYDNLMPPLFDVLVEARGAECYDSRDKVYGLLGVCAGPDTMVIKPSYAIDYPETRLYRDLAVHHLLNVNPILGSILDCVDHESADLPSWVPDWRKPRRSYSLGHAGTTRTAYMACRNPKVEVGKVLARLEGEHKDQWRLQGVVFDTIMSVSIIFDNPYLSLSEPVAENKALKEMHSFVAGLKQYPGHETVFSAFWQTLVAGKDATEMAKAPVAYEEILSFLIDASTGLSPSLPGQTYSARQKRPVGKGKLDLESFKTRVARKTFQEVATAMMHAMQNRRLCLTSKGYLGLLPETGRVGDEVYVLEACHVPFLLRKVDKRRHRLVGECYVHGIMHGEAVPDDMSMDDVILV